MDTDIQSRMRTIYSAKFLSFSSSETSTSAHIQSKPVNNRSKTSIDLSENKMSPRRSSRSKKTLPMNKAPVSRTSKLNGRSYPNLRTMRETKKIKECTSSPDAKMAIENQTLAAQESTTMPSQKCTTASRTVLYIDENGAFLDDGEGEENLSDDCQIITSNIRQENTRHPESISSLTEIDEAVHKTVDLIDPNNDGFSEKPRRMASIIPPESLLNASNQLGFNLLFRKTNFLCYHYNGLDDLLTACHYSDHKTLYEQNSWGLYMLAQAAEFVSDQLASRQKQTSDLFEDQQFMFDGQLEHTQEHPTSLAYLLAHKSNPMSQVLML
ncbi:uncharacterized protein L203_105268 [Cryptococcus depauperatus CBS 7841]|uniref:Uncharacterized protein n=1 Tax=Cryptococcus depauperatus CBS 7841 TaxID=1295531 RepID=A0AAJ8JX41_9TREE